MITMTTVFYAACITAILILGTLIKDTVTI
jgi:hypothetical protein